MSLASFGRELLAEVRRIAEQIVRRDGTNLRWATVTDTDPLRIRYDGETSESIVPPQNLAAGLNIGDRVRIAKQDGQATIIGPHGGHRAISDGTYGLHVGADESGPRLWADSELFRDYVGNDPDGSTNQLMLVSPRGSFGVLTDQISRDYLARASGRVNITPSAANTPTSATVTFPAGRFTSTPEVFTTIYGTGPGTIVTGSAATGFSTSSATIWVTRTNTTTTTVGWVATQE